MIACDIDGTLLEYGNHSSLPTFNIALGEKLSNITTFVSLVTNQGGLPFSGELRRDGRPYPHPLDVVQRIIVLDGCLRMCNIAIKQIAICVYHPRAKSARIDWAARLLRRGLKPIYGRRVVVYTTAQARKPEPKMLLDVCATTYYGDDDCDAQAAQAAGIEFVRVPRFYG